MLVPHLLAAYVFVGLSLFVLGFLLSRQAPQSTAPRFVAVVTGILEALRKLILAEGMVQGRRNVEQV